MTKRPPQAIGPSIGVGDNSSIFPGPFSISPGLTCDVCECNVNNYAELRRPQPGLTLAFRDSNASMLKPSRLEQTAGQFGQGAAPRQKHEVEDHRRQPLPTRGPTRRSRPRPRLLIVDDSPHTGELYSEYLTFSG